MFQERAVTGFVPVKRPMRLEADCSLAFCTPLRAKRSLTVEGHKQPNARIFQIVLTNVLYPFHHNAILARQGQTPNLQPLAQTPRTSQTPREVPVL